MTSPIVSPLLVAPADLARRAGLDPDDPAVAADLDDALRDAMVDVRTYLGRPIVPTKFTERGVRPDEHGWVLATEPVIEVISVVTEYDSAGVPTGLYTVMYWAGLDARTGEEFESIRRWVLAAALVHPSIVRRVRAAGGGRVVRSVSADGQSITYADAGPSPDQASTGGVPSLESLDYWRIANRRVFT